MYSADPTHQEGGSGFLPRTARCLNLADQLGHTADGTTDLPVVINQTSSRNLRFDSGIQGCIFRPVDENTEILREIRDLLRLMAEPALAKRDERLRASLEQIIGKSKQKAEAVFLMDGTRSQAAIRKGCGIDHGNLSRLVKALRVAELTGQDDKHPKLSFPIPSNLLHTVGNNKE